ncbi:unnamed protein product, partial [Rhizoctonia solani]
DGLRISRMEKQNKISTELPPVPTPEETPPVDEELDLAELVPPVLRGSPSRTPSSPLAVEPPSLLSTFTKPRAPHSHERQRVPKPGLNASTNGETRSEPALIGIAPFLRAALTPGAQFLLSMARKRLGALARLQGRRYEQRCTYAQQEPCIVAQELHSKHPQLNFPD